MRKVVLVNLVLVMLVLGSVVQAYSQSYLHISVRIDYGDSLYSSSDHLVLVRGGIEIAQALIRLSPLNLRGEVEFCLANPESEELSNLTLIFQGRTLRKTLVPNLTLPSKPGELILEFSLPGGKGERKFIPREDYFFSEPVLSHAPSNPLAGPELRWVFIDTVRATNYPSFFYNVPLPPASHKIYGSLIRVDGDSSWYGLDSGNLFGNWPRYCGKFLDYFPYPWASNSIIGVSTLSYWPPALIEITGVSGSGRTYWQIQFSGISNPPYPFGGYPNVSTFFPIGGKTLMITTFQGNPEILFLNPTNGNFLSISISLEEWDDYVVVSEPSLFQDSEGIVYLAIQGRFRAYLFRYLNDSWEIMPGWPVTNGYPKGSRMIFCDLDQDGTPELLWPAAFSAEIKFLAYRLDGSPLEDFSSPDLSLNLQSHVAVGDLDQDGYYEIVFVSNFQLYVLEHTGEIKNGFPFVYNIGPLGLLSTFYSDPLVVFVEEDLPALIIGTNTNDCWPWGFCGEYHAYTQEGSLVEGWPIVVDGLTSDVTPSYSSEGSRVSLVLGVTTHTSPWDSLGTANIYNFELPVAPDTTQFLWTWRTYGGNEHRTGYPGYYPPPVTSVEFQNPELPFSPLLGNYPNPFNSTTRIVYQLSTNSEVKLEIYNLLGQKIATLVNKQQEAGIYSVTWDASDLSSGVYFSKLTTPDYACTKKMNLLR